MQQHKITREWQYSESDQLNCKSNKYTTVLLLMQLK